MVSDSSFTHAFIIEEQKGNIIRFFLTTIGYRTSIFD